MGDPFCSEAGLSSRKPTGSEGDGRRHAPSGHFGRGRTAYAIEHHFDRLEEDHRRAAAIGERLEANGAVASVASVETNIVIASLPEGRAAGGDGGALRLHGVLCSAFGPDKVRWVTHLDFGEADLARVLAAVDAWSDGRGLTRIFRA